MGLLIPRVVNRLIKPLGWRLVRVPPFQLALEALYRTGIEVRFVQVGANDGIRFDGLYFTVTSNRWSGIVIEPLPHMFARLAFNYSDYPDVVPVNVAIHPTLTSEKIYHVNPLVVCDYPDWASGIASFNRHHLVKHGIRDQDILAIDVPCKPLMSVIGEHELFDAEVLQIDTEGFDAEIIGMIDFSRFKPWVIKFEWMNLSQAQKTFCLDRLVQEGYKFSIDHDESDCTAWLPRLAV
ncbi:MAG: FkbM family methyltransferase [Porticoccaceae bacterium]|nr:FkbM family methyltransferase [Porticoccaceae bacterium]